MSTPPQTAPSRPQGPAQSTTPAEGPAPAPKPGLWRSAGLFVVRWSLRVGAWAVALWCVLALGFDLPYVGWPLGLAFLVFLIWRVRLAERERVRLAWVAGGCLIVVAWWVLLPPRNDRDWVEGSSKLAVPEFDGSKVKILNLRDFEHVSDKMVKYDWKDEEFDLDELESVDVVFDDFLGDGPVSHTMLSFGFKGERYFCLSIETRLAKGCPYDIPRACFKGYEIIYHLGYERDMIYQCTNVLEQPVYLYRLKLTPEQRRTLCEGVLRKAANLSECPEWYNFLTNNCTNNLLWHANAHTIDWREREVFLNGTGHRLLYERNLITHQLPVDELRERSKINERAKRWKWRDDPKEGRHEFSRLIREKLLVPTADE